jgi:capsular polysaccharide biosynthesis protein
VYGEKGVVIGPDDTLLADVSIELGRAPADHSIFWAPTMRACRRVSGSVAVIAAVGCDSYYHWLFDVLPRLDLLSRAGVQADYYYVPDHLPFQSEALDSLGIPKDRRVRPTARTHIRGDTLLVPSLPSWSSHVSPWSVDYLRERLGVGSERGARRRLYVTRERARARHVVNEGEVQQVLLKHGFEIVRSETLSLRRQVELFGEAEAVVGPHGAGLSNLVFCPPGVKVVEFFAPTYVNLCYWVLCNHLEARYFYVLASGPVPPVGCYPHRGTDDLTIPIDQLGAVLRQAGID